MPWWVRTLIVGVLLVIVAFLLTFDGFPGGFFVFLLAAAAVVAGLVGLGLHYQRERKQNTEAEEETAAPRVYRRFACRIEQSLVDRLSRAVTVLKQRAEDNHWEPDWSVHEKHHALALELQKAGDLVGAFREYCRAMLPLSQALAGTARKKKCSNPSGTSTTIRCAGKSIRASCRGEARAKRTQSL